MATMKKQLAFVLGGGGARGALQVGALRALLEAGYVPDMLVGTSIGAVNAAFLAIHGVNLAGVDQLQQAWMDSAAADLLPADYLWLTVRVLFNRQDVRAPNRIQEIFLNTGMDQDLRFSDITGVRLFAVTSDLNSGRTVIYGDDPDEHVLEGVLSSAALPPWISPLLKDGKWLIDGGAVSNVPIEPAIRLGATEIIALDLADTRSTPSAAHSFGIFLERLLITVQRRQLDLEMALAQEKHIPVRYANLTGPGLVMIWDFARATALFDHGYQLMHEEIQRWQAEKPPGWREKLSAFFRR